jgi:[acyl-carrier-protein] S-malonyltransferase
MIDQNYNIAFVFPGQGSQSLGMLAKLAEAYPEVKHTFEQASDVLGFDLWDLAQTGPEETLNQTQYTQPAMLAAGVAVWRVWQKRSQRSPAWMAGHSLGEYTALVCSEAILFEDAVKLVAERGRLMQEAVPIGAGAMAAVLGLEDHLVVNACADVAHGQVVSAANFNAPGQVVIAGDTDAIDRAMTALKDLGAKKVVKLPVSVPSHCVLMSKAAEKLDELLQGMNVDMPKATLIHNADVKSHGSPEVIRYALKEQLFKPVRWVEIIKFMSEQGVSVFVECGPGKVLVGLDKRIAKEAVHLSIFDPESIDQVLEQLHG